MASLFTIDAGQFRGFVALMIWMYWTSFVLLVGAELNACSPKEYGRRRIPAGFRLLRSITPISAASGGF
jgi:uncharacterized BrkB/YihY/UPF0761 family membrane protein